MKTLGILVLTIASFLAGAGTMFYLDRDYFEAKASGLSALAWAEELRGYNELLLVSKFELPCRLNKLAEIKANSLMEFQPTQMGAAKAIFGDAELWKLSKSTALEEYSKIEKPQCE